MLRERDGLGGGNEVDAGKEVDDELDGCVFVGDFAVDGGDGLRGPEAHEACVVVGAEAAVEGGEVDLFCDGAEFGGEVYAAGHVCYDALEIPILARPFSNIDFAWKGNGAWDRGVEH